MRGERRVRVAAEDGLVLDGVVEEGAVRAGDESIPVLDGDTLVLGGGWRVVRPVDPSEVWAAGVTYERSRDARMDESEAAKDAYQLVYEADRPELFLKDAGCRRTVGPGEPIAVRSDSAWNVPEPEIALVLDEGLRPSAVTVGNDVSSREIEGANPLYLPQAKVFAACCALGPAVVVPDDWSQPWPIELRILDGDETVWEGATSTSRMRRSFDELAGWLRRDNPVPPGSVLLTGTGLVPPDEISLAPGHTVEIRVPGIGTLVNPVVATSDL